MVTKPIRIVPLHDGAPAAARKRARLTYRKGPLLTAVEVFTVFWGKEWQGPQAPLATQLDAFFKYALASPLMDQLGEYSRPTHKLRHGSLKGTATVTVTQPKPVTTDADIQAAILGWIKDKTLPAQDANSLTFVFLPPGVSADLQGQRSCSSFCGYHDSIGGSTFYAVMPYPGCSGCLGGLTELEALTSTSSHELCEAITDPVPGQGWYDDANGEIGDICAWKTKVIGGWTVQLEWSNRAGRCV